MQTATQTDKPTTPLTPVTLFNESYRELVSGEFGQNQRAWMRILTDMQEANARWCARRQEMIQQSAAVWLNADANNPQSIAAAWRAWAHCSTQRWIDDVADQVEVGLKAFSRMSENVTAPEEAPAKLKRAKPRANGDVTHH